MGKNNTTAKTHQATGAQQRYSLRKLSIGTVSVLIGLTFFGIQVTAQAATTDQQAETEQVSADMKATKAVELKAPTVQATPPATATEGMPAATQEAAQPAMPTMDANWLQTPAVDKLAGEQPKLQEQLTKLKQEEAAKSQQALKQSLKMELAARLKGVPREADYLASFERENDPTKLMNLFTELSDKQVLHQRDITDRKIVALRAKGKADLQKADPKDIRRLADETVRKVELTRAGAQADSLVNQLKAAQFKLAGYHYLDEGTKEKLRSELAQLRTEGTQFSMNATQMMEPKAILADPDSTKANDLIKSVRDLGQKARTLIDKVDETNAKDVTMAREKALADLPKLASLMNGAPVVKAATMKAFEEDIKMAPTSERIAILMSIAEKLELPAMEQPAPMMPEAPKGQPAPMMPQEAMKVQPMTMKPAGPTMAMTNQASPTMMAMKGMAMGAGHHSGAMMDKMDQMKLPQTGTDQGLAMAALGTSLLALTGLFGLKFRRRGN